MKNFLFALSVTCCYNGILIGQTSYFSETKEVIERYIAGDSIENSLNQFGGTLLNRDERINEYGEGVVVYPNPVSGELMIDLEEYTGPVLVRIYDIDLSLLNISKERSLDMSSYRIGIYILEVEYNSRIKVVRVVKN